MLISILKTMKCVKIFFMNINVLQVNLILRNFANIASQWLLLLTMRSASSRLEIATSLQYSSVKQEKRKTAGEARKSELSNTIERNMQSWAVSRLTVRLRVSVLSIRIVACRVPGQMWASGRFLLKRLHSTFPSSSDVFFSKFTMVV